MGMIYKKISKTGSIQLPIQFRREHGLHPGDAYKIEMQKDGSVKLTPHTSHCIFCGGVEEVRMLDGKGICMFCALKVKEAFSDESK